MITNLRDQLLRDEGCKLTTYKDSLGLWTIGVGHLLDQTKDWTGHTITQAEANELLDGDIARSSALCAHLLGTDQVRNAVIENMAFNVGITRLLGFKKFLAAFQAQDWHTASVEMLDSRWAAQVGPRATRLSRQVLTGEWQ